MFKVPAPRTSVLGARMRRQQGLCSGLQANHSVCVDAGLDRLAAQKRAEAGAPEGNGCCSSWHAASCAAGVHSTWCGVSLPAWLPAACHAAAAKRPKLSFDASDDAGASEATAGGVADDPGVAAAVSRGGDGGQQRRFRGQRLDTPSHPGEGCRGGRQLPLVHPTGAVSLHLHHANHGCSHHPHTCCTAAQRGCTAAGSCVK